MMIRVTIGGDFCITPQHTSDNLFSKELGAFFHNSDLNIVNLECPLLDEKIYGKITKTGPHIYSNEDVLNRLKKLNIHAVTLANNHILDFGEEGLINTLKGCRENNLAVVGAGENFAKATKPEIIKRNGIRIGLVNFCENEWSIADENRAGANPLDIIENLNQIKIARELADYVFVIIHGGHEYYNLPSPRMVKTYRFFAENGADAIIAHHPHCFSGFEIHKNVPIFYSLGNFIFTKPNRRESWYTGLILQLIIEKDQPLQFKLFPVLQSVNNFEVSFAKNGLKEKTYKEVEHYSGIIKNDTELKKNWNSFVQGKQKSINIFSPLNFIPGKYVKAILNRLGLNKIVIRKQNLVQILNYIRCESHRDVICQILNNKIDKK